MANATAAEAYAAVVAIEDEQKTENGYINSVRLDVALARIIADVTGVTTTAEAQAGIDLAVGANVHRNLGYLDSTGPATDTLYLDALAEFVFSGRE